jgi:hypothetical protein
MRRFGLSMSLAVALAGLSYTAANALPFACAVDTAANPKARIVLHGKTIASCAAGSPGCKCVSCYDLMGSVYSACYPLYVMGIPSLPGLPK